MDTKKGHKDFNITNKDVVSRKNKMVNLKLNLKKPKLNPLLRKTYMFLMKFYLQCSWSWIQIQSIRVQARSQELFRVGDISCCKGTLINISSTFSHGWVDCRQLLCIMKIEFQVIVLEFAFITLALESLPICGRSQFMKKYFVHG